MHNIYKCTNLNLTSKLNNIYRKSYLKREIYYHYLISLIRHLTFMGQANEDGYVTINSEKLRSLFKSITVYQTFGETTRRRDTQTLTLIREDLIRWGVINYYPQYDKKDDQYRTKALYKLMDEYLYDFTPINWNDYDQEYVLRVICNNYFDTSTLEGIYKEVYEIHKDVKLDRNSAIKWIEQAYKDNLELKPKYKDGQIQRRFMDLKRKSKYLYVLDNFNCHYMFTSPNCGRTYTNLNGFPSVLRPFTYFEEENTSSVGVDIRCSQPLMLSILLKYKYEEGSEILNETVCELFGETYSEIFSEKIGEDVSEFIRLTESGGLYDYLKEVFDRNSIKYDEDIFKPQFFCNIFYSTEKRSNKMRDIFDEVFPGVGSLISEMKENCYKELPILLQKLESILMEKVWRKLLDENISFYPIHDCLQVSNDDETIQRVDSLILEEFEEIGMSPSIHIN